MLGRFTSNKMKRIQLILAIGGASVAAAVAARWSATAENHHMVRHGKDLPQQSAKASDTPVLVELFTSEGCSSCPPADELLAKFKDEQPVSGAHIIALSEHVDYWNNESWEDRFSKSEFSDRQNLYSEALPNNQVYTPQLVVDGKSAFVGSDQVTAISSIASAAKLAKPKLNLEIGAIKNNLAEVKISGTGVTSDPKNELLIAVTEDNLMSSVRGGENSGRSLSHAAVARSLERVAWKGAGTNILSVKLDPSWKRENLSVVAFIQERKSRHILTAAEVRLN